MIPSTSTRQAIPVAVRPRTSSKTSGLRFCGMIEEPVVISGLSVTKPSSFIEKRTRSAASRPRSWSSSATSNSTCASALPRESWTAVTGSWTSAKPRLLARGLAVDRQQRHAVARGRAQRVLVRAGAGRRRGRRRRRAARRRSRRPRAGRSSASRAAGGCSREAASRPLSPPGHRAPRRRSRLRRASASTSSRR